MIEIEIKDSVEIIQNRNKINYFVSGIDAEPSNAAHFTFVIL